MRTWNLRYQAAAPFSPAPCSSPDGDWSEDGAKRIKAACFLISISSSQNFGGVAILILGGWADRWDLCSLGQLLRDWGEFVFVFMGYRMQGIFGGRCRVFKIQAVASLDHIESTTPVDPFTSSSSGFKINSRHLHPFLGLRAERGSLLWAIGKIATAVSRTNLRKRDGLN